MRQALLFLIIIIPISCYATESRDNDSETAPHIIRISLWTTDEGVICTVNDRHTTIANIGRRLEPYKGGSNIRLLILVAPTVPTGIIFDVMDVIRDHGLSKQVILVRSGDATSSGHTIKLDGLDDLLEPEEDEEDNSPVDIEIIRIEPDNRAYLRYAAGIFAL